MTGGIIQLVARSIHDKFLIDNPEISFFKIIYRRHTNFAMEDIKQNFIHNMDFGKKGTCNITKSGDLINYMTLVVTLPNIHICDSIAEFAWVKKIGFALIKSVEIEIGGFIIDKHYSDWLNIWYELTQIKSFGYNKMVGDIKELFEYSKDKDEYTIYIPLQFWFCRSSNLALPIIALQFSEVKLHLDINEFENCFKISPSNYIEVENDIIPFKKFDYIEQITEQNEIIGATFIKYDIMEKRLYYIKHGIEDFKSFDKENNIYNKNCKNYWINSKYGRIMPKFNTQAKKYCFEMERMNLKNVHLLVNYIYLDNDERERFLRSKHDYLIEQLYYSGEKTLKCEQESIKLDFYHPSKALFWTVQYDYLLNMNDLFNYTDKEESIITDEELLLNGLDRINIKNYKYFQLLQIYYFFTNSSSPGINTYSFSLYPENIYPTGTCNLTQINYIEFILRLKDVSQHKTAKFKAFSLNYNILRIVSGLAGLVFTR
jgi:hypothetical protein